MISDRMQLLDRVQPALVRRGGLDELGLEPFGQRHVEEGVERITPHVAGHLRDRHSDIALMFGLVDDLDPQHVG